MIELPGMLMIGATGRKLGKTELACRLLSRFGREVPICGVKVTPIDPGDDCCPSGREGCGVCSSLEGPFEIVEETEPGGDKDTGRLLAAGARRVLWLRARRSELAAGAAALARRLGAGVAICESASLRQVARPDLFLLVRGPADQPAKDSARSVRPLADRLVRRVDDGFDFSLDEIALAAGRWSMPVAAGGILLAGGASVRMGADKSLLAVDGRPLIARVAEQLGGWLGGLLVSANDADKVAFLGLPVVPDAQPGQGPLMGIASALRASAFERNLVVACDMPLIDRALARELLARAGRAEIAVPVDPQGRHEPLFAAYRRSVAERMFAVLAEGKRRIVDVFDRCRVERLALTADERLVNLNTRAELQDFLERLG